MTYRELLSAAVRRMEEAKVPEASLDAWYLLEYVFGVRREWFLLEGGRTIPDSDEGMTESFWQLVEKRCRRIPMQYLTGVQEFMGLSFAVNPHVLIPRQDTEQLVEAALAVAHPGSKVLDMCTGSGCILISLLVLGKQLMGCGVDVSEEALAVARENGKRNGVEAQWLQSDLFDRVEGRYHMLISNPPYIPTEVIKTLMPEVRDHEPPGALDGRGDGLFFYREIIKRAADYLLPEGWLLFEIGCDQGSRVAEMMRSKGFLQVEIRQDYSGHDRVVMGHL